MNNILVLTYWSYPDALIQTYTLPYLRMIRKNLSPDSRVFLLTLEKDPSTLARLSRVEITEELAKEGIRWLPFQYRPFGLSAFFLWLGISFRLLGLITLQNISTIHCWCTPPGAIGYFLAIFLNRKLVLDSFEPHAEAMIENGTWKKNGFAFRILFWLERKQAKRADFVIATTRGMRQYAVEKYGVFIENFFVKPACVDLHLFSKRNIKNPKLLKELNLEDKIVCVYAGKFGGIYLDREVFDFFKVASEYWGEKFSVLLLSNHTREEVQEYCKQSGCDFSIIALRYVPHRDIPPYLGLADFAISPVKPVPTKRFCSPIKDGEYWALGLPTMIPVNISDDSEIIEVNKGGVVLSGFKKNDFQAALMKMDALLKEPKEEMFLKIRSLAERYRSFEIAETIYRQIYGV